MLISLNEDNTYGSVERVFIQCFLNLLLKGCILACIYMDAWGYGPNGYIHMIAFDALLPLVTHAINFDQ